MRNLFVQTTEATSIAALGNLITLGAPLVSAGTAAKEVLLDSQVAEERIFLSPVQPVCGLMALRTFIALCSTGFFQLLNSKTQCINFIRDAFQPLPYRQRIESLE